MQYVEEQVRGRKGVTAWFVEGKRNIIVPHARHHMAGLIRGAALTCWDKALPSVNATLNT